MIKLITYRWNIHSLIWEWFRIQLEVPDIENTDIQGGSNTETWLRAISNHTEYRKSIRNG